MTSIALTALTQIVIMFFIIIVGIVCYKLKLIDKNTNKKLSDLVLLLVNPIVIFVSYQRDFDISLLKGLFISILLALFTHILAIVLSKLLLFKNKTPDHKPLERFAMIYSNCGFIGIPLVNGVFGSEGVFYLTAYMTIFNLFVWTHGVIMMTDRGGLRSLLRALITPSVIATLSGFVFFIVRIQLPDIVMNALNYIGNMNTPLAMLVAGVTIAQTNPLRLLKKPRIFYVSFIKLLLMPLLMLCLYSYLPIPSEVLLTSILATACPTAVTISLFSIRYDKDYLYASEIFAVTTILSVVTIPIVMTLGGFLVA